MKQKIINYTWRTYLASDLEKPAKIAAITAGKDVRQFLSEIISNNLIEVKH